MTTGYFVGVGADAFGAPVDFFAFFFFVFLVPFVAGVCDDVLTIVAVDEAGAVP